MPPCREDGAAVVVVVGVLCVPWGRQVLGRFLGVVHTSAGKEGSQSHAPLSPVELLPR